jgi:NAD(P)H dehydrogenase (quinone)
MNVLFVHAHPEPRSFNAALTQVGVEHFRSAGACVEVSDLYAQQFDPRECATHYSERADPTAFSALREQRHANATGKLSSDIAREIGRLQRADLVVFQFPIWWYAPPAMLKGWIDRVFINGGLYSSETRFDRGCFAGKSAICSVTSALPEEAFDANRQGGLIRSILWPVQFSLYYVGFQNLREHVSYGIGDGVGRSLLESAKANWRRRLEHVHCAEIIEFPNWAELTAQQVSNKPGVTVPGGEA